MYKCVYIYTHTHICVCRHLMAWFMRLCASAHRQGLYGLPAAVAAPKDGPCAVGQSREEKETRCNVIASDDTPGSCPAPIPPTASINPPTVDAAEELRFT